MPVLFSFIFWNQYYLHYTTLGLSKNDLRPLLNRLEGGLNIGILFYIVFSAIELLLNHSPFTGNVVNLIEGMSAELKCTSSDSSAVITWKKSGDPYFIISDEKLTIQNVQRMHSGSYTCTAAITNAQTERTVQVNVLCTSFSVVFNP